MNRDKTKDKTKDNTRDKIIEAALEEFATKGYRRASTNNIVERAGVSKGMLFYYFKNKEELYRYLIEQSIEKSEKSYLTGLFEKTGDLLDRCKELSSLKLRAYLENPKRFNFFGNAFLNDRDVPELKDIISREIELNNKIHEMFYANLDTSELRDDIPCDELLKMIRWTIDGYESELLVTLKEMDISKSNLSKLWDDFDEFIDNLHTIFYKQTVFIK